MSQTIQIPGPEVLEKQTRFYHEAMAAVVTVLQEPDLVQKLAAFGTRQEHLHISITGVASKTDIQLIVRDCKAAGWKNVRVVNKAVVDDEGVYHTVVIMLYTSEQQTAESGGLS